MPGMSPAFPKCRWVKMSVSERRLAGGSQAFLKLLLGPVCIPSSVGWGSDGEPRTMCGQGNCLFQGNKPGPREGSNPEEAVGRKCESEGR